jgi:Zn finger protein HypA/HybF involved in hydrogenase expression
MYKLDRKERNCLKCGKPFMSDGVGNRICSRCTSYNARIRMGNVPMSHNPSIRKFERDDE